MGMYDVLPRGSQVNLWYCTLDTKDVGDKVPTFGFSQYIVLLREGGYVLVEEGKIVYIEETEGKRYYLPEDFPGIPCFDKYGRSVLTKEDLSRQFQGLLGREDPHYLRKEGDVMEIKVTKVPKIEIPSIQCPECGSELQSLQFLISDSGIGTCPNCSTNLKWEKVRKEV